MDKKYYLVYVGGYENEPKGIIIGSEDDARKWCEAYNAKCKYSSYEVGFEEIEVLTDEDLRDTI